MNNEKLRPLTARLPHSLHILDMRHVIRLVTHVFAETDEGQQIPRHREIEVVNWCVMELIDSFLRDHDRRLIGHYVDDDGKTLMSQMTPAQRSNLNYLINGLLRDIVKGGRRFSALMTGYDVILSKELEYSGN